MECLTHGPRRRPELLPAEHQHKEARLRRGGAGQIAACRRRLHRRATSPLRIVSTNALIDPSVERQRTRSAAVGVAQAFANGADYIVVGRPIRDAADPRAAAEAIQATIAGSSS